MNEQNLNTPLKTLRRLLRAMHTPGIQACPTSIYLLAETARRDVVTAKELAITCFGPDGKYIHRHLTGLEDAGYISWIRQAGWKRSEIRITRAGRELLWTLAEVLDRQPPPSAKAKHPQLIKSA